MDGQLQDGHGNKVTTLVTPENPLTLKTCSFVSKLMLYLSRLNSTCKDPFYKAKRWQHYYFCFSANTMHKPALTIHILGFVCAYLLSLSDWLFVTPLYGLYWWCFSRTHLPIEVGTSDGSLACSMLQMWHPMCVAFHVTSLRTPLWLPNEIAGICPHSRLRCLLQEPHACDTTVKCP